MNKTYQSPYRRRIEFPCLGDLSADKRMTLQQILQSLKSDGVPDTIAYLTEEEVLSATEDLEAIGYDRYSMRVRLAVPAQSNVRLLPSFLRALTVHSRIPYIFLKEIS